MVTRGDGSLTIAWDTPENEGSALGKYVVRLIVVDRAEPHRRRHGAERGRPR